MTAVGVFLPAGCSDVSVGPQRSPFLCLDLVYISALLQELGFPPHKQFRVSFLSRFYRFL